MGMANSGCCCENPTGGVPDDPCLACLPTETVDCLTIQKSTWAKPRKMIPWGEFLNSTTTELCGEMAAGGLNQAYVEGSPDYCRYFGTYILTWKVNGRVTGAEDDNCDKINIHFQFRPDQWETYKYGILRRGAPRTFIVQADRDWITTGITFDEPEYANMHALYPEQFPLPIPTYTISPGCPEDFPKLDEAPVILHGEAGQDPPTGTDWCNHTPDINSYSAGTLYIGECITPCPKTTDRRFAPGWLYDTETDEIVLYSSGGNYLGGYGWENLWRQHCVPSREGFETTYPGAVWPWDGPWLEAEQIRIAFDDGGWKDAGPWEFTTPYDPVVVAVAKAIGTYTASLAEDCPLGPDPWEPPGPVRTCFKKSLCLQVRMNKDETDPDAPTFESYTQCTIPWVKGINKYFYEYCDGPDARPFKVRVTVWEDPASIISGYPTYYRAWRILIEIVDLTTEALIEDHEEVVMLNCYKDWSYTHTFTIDDEAVEVYIGTKCPTLTIVPPPSCDPLCWPECVLCPTTLSMSIVVDQNPVCCFHGTFGLTYDSGTNTFYLASPVGYVAGFCGGIRTFVMSCASSSTVTFTWTYRNENGTDISRTDTVSASCTGGSFETAAVDVLSALFAPALCDRGIGKGASVRVVGI